MAVTGSCHCGAVRVEVPEPPEWVASCNCSICRKLGSLVAYYTDDGRVQITGETKPYIHGDRMIAFLNCPTCACHMGWESTGESYGKVGVNARMLDGFEMRDAGGSPVYAIGGRELEVRLLDNADD